MGGAVSSIVDSVVSPVADVVGGAVDIAGNALQGVAKNPIGAGIGLATGNYAPLIGGALGGALGGGGQQSLASGYMPSQQGGYGSGGSMMGPQPIIINNTPGQTAADQQQSMFMQMLPFLMQTGGGLAQGQVNKEAAQTQADALRAAGQQAATASQFRPVGTTTRFGTSNYQVNPTTGQLESAGYTLSPEAQAYQNALGGMTNQGLMQGQQMQSLANQYLGESPEAVRQRYMDQQNALVAGSNEQALAGIRNNLFQTGRQGLATGATTAGGMAATNPEMAAYYNALAKQQAGFAAGADTAAQNQIKFGQGLAADAYSPFTTGFGAQGAVEKAAQQPMDLSTNLAAQFQKANQQGGAYNLDAQTAAANAMLKANQESPFADIMSALGKTPAATTALGGAVGGMLGGLFGGNNAQAGQANTGGGGGGLGNVNLGGLGSLFNSDSLNFGGWNSGGTSVYNPDAFSLSGDYGSGTDALGWDTSGINGWF